MAKKIYRLCLIAFLVLTILAGLLYYNRISRNRGRENQDLLLVEDVQSEHGSVMV